MGKQLTSLALDCRRRFAEALAIDDQTGSDFRQMKRVKVAWTAKMAFRPSNPEPVRNHL
jgi:hypothetical protein